MNAFELFMTVGCVASILLFTMTVVQDKIIEKKRKKDSPYRFLV